MEKENVCCKDGKCEFNIEEEKCNCGEGCNCDDDCTCGDDCSCDESCACHNEFDENETLKMQVENLSNVYVENININPSIDNLKSLAFILFFL